MDRDSLWWPILGVFGLPLLIIIILLSFLPDNRPPESVDTGSSTSRYSGEGDAYVTVPDGYGGYQDVPVGGYDPLEECLADGSCELSEPDLGQ